MIAWILLRLPPFVISGYHIRMFWLPVRWDGRIILGMAVLLCELVASISYAPFAGRFLPTLMAQIDGYLHRFYIIVTDTCTLTCWMRWQRCYSYGLLLYVLLDLLQVLSCVLWAQNIRMNRRLSLFPWITLIQRGFWTVISTALDSDRIHPGYFWSMFLITGEIMF